MLVSVVMCRTPSPSPASLTYDASSAKPKRDTLEVRDFERERIATEWERSGGGSGNKRRGKGVQSKKKEF